MIELPVVHVRIKSSGIVFDAISKICSSREMSTAPSSSEEVPDPLVRDACAAISWACGRYDAGLEHMALHIAVASKPLFQGTRDHEPILSRHNQIRSFGLCSTTSLNVGGNTLGFIMLAPDKAGYHPELNRAARREVLPLDLWWRGESILQMPRTPARAITRQQLILASTGEFTNPEALSKDDYLFLEEGFRVRLQLGMKNSLTKLVSLKNAHLAALRQIGFEILSSSDMQTLAGPRPKGIELSTNVEIESEMNRFVVSSGGRLVIDLVGPSPDFHNADYLFLNDNVIAELKCLTQDKSDDDDLQRKLQRLLDQAVDHGLIPDPGPGQYVFETKTAPPEVQRDVYALFARSIKRRLAKANKQIRETKSRLNLPNALGLVLLANDGNFRLEPAQLTHAVTVALGRDFSSINSLVLFTVNMLATTPSLAQHTNVWISGSRPHFPAISSEFLNRFSEGWFAHLSSVLKVPMPVVKLNASDLESLRYDRQIFDTPR